MGGMDYYRTAFSDSNDVSSACYKATTAPYGSSTANNNNSINHHLHHSATESPEPLADTTALRRLSDNLDSIFNPDPDSDSDSYADAKILVGSGSTSREVAVHRCLLSARSPFFKAAFKAKRREMDWDSQRDREKSGGGVKLHLADLAGDFKVGFEALVGVLGYLYCGKVWPLPKDVCVCVDNDCPHLGCRPAVDFMLEVLYLSFTFQIAELVSLYQRHLLEILNQITPDDLLSVICVANLCRSTCERLYSRCIDILVKSDMDGVALEKSLTQHIVKEIMNFRKELGLIETESNLPDKHVKRIHRALDSDDVELVTMLLKEGHTTLDKAFALHYAVKHCDAKTTTELLDLGLADVNCKNSRGYTVLHIAAIRKEPKIIISLLTKGARPTDVTLDGRKALQIAKRLTKAIDWYKPPEEGKDSHNDRLCIEILEQAERRGPISLGEASVSLAMAGDNMRSRLLYLENRVGLARLLFPMEAKVAMEIAQVDGTTEFTLSMDVKDTVDLNEAPFIFKEEHRRRMTALAKTVELGKRFFPRCSNVLDKIMDTNNLTELANMGNDTPEERMTKKQRYMELQEVFTKAFSEDKEAFERSNLSSSSSSTSMVKQRQSFGRLSFKR